MVRSNASSDFKAMYGFLKLNWVVYFAMNSSIAELENHEAHQILDFFIVIISKMHWIIFLE